VLLGLCFCQEAKILRKVEGDVLASFLYIASASSTPQPAGSVCSLLSWLLAAFFIEERQLCQDSWTDSGITCLMYETTMCSHSPVRLLVFFPISLYIKDEVRKW